MASGAAPAGRVLSRAGVAGDFAGSTAVFLLDFSVQSRGPSKAVITGQLTPAKRILPS